MHVFRIVALALAMMCWLTAEQAFAAPLTYDEAADGDIADQLTTFNLDVGANVVKGNVYDLGTGTDFDLFDVNLPVSSTISSIDLTISNNGGSHIPGFFGWRTTPSGTINKVYTTYYGSYHIPLNLNIDHLYYIGLNSFYPGVNANYEITLNVTPTPLPAALPLFLTMLAGIGGLRWRRRKVA